MLEIASIKFAYGALKDVYSFTSKFIKAPAKGDVSSFKSHIVSAESWSSSVNMFGMSSPVDVDLSTIELNLSSQPRRFFIKQRSESVISERDVIKSRLSYVILGDPGSGKTTTVKRLLRKMILSDPEDVGDDYLFPILVLGRELNLERTLFDDLFHKVGFSFDKSNSEPSNPKEVEPWKRERLEDVKKAVRHTLTNSRVVIFVDGIDEIDGLYRARFISDLEDINNVMSFGKMVVTCRSGDWTSAPGGFSILEVCPLRDQDIVDIVQSWSSSPAAFLEAVKAVPYRDILDRPLFLTMLIMLFNQGEELPDNPVDVYYRIVNLMIDRWDSQRGIKRVSRYGKFLAERKFKFLSALAFDLIARFGVRRFTSYHLEVCTMELAPAFKLPQNQSEQIVQEIESHTGIIIEAGYRKFEFSHLTVQEFLAANYLIGSGSDKNISATFISYPSILAVTVALSTASSTYFARVVIVSLCTIAAIFFRNEVDNDFADNFTAHLPSERLLETIPEKERSDYLPWHLAGKKKQKVGDYLELFRPFVNRLTLEKPSLVFDEELGCAILYLAFAYEIVSHSKVESKEREAALSELDFTFSLEGVRASVQQACTKFEVTKRDGPSAGPTIRFSGERLCGLKIPERLKTLEFSADVSSLMKKHHLARSIFDYVAPKYDLDEYDTIRKNL